MHKVKLSTKAQKDLKHLARTVIYDKIVAVLHELSRDPYSGDIKCLTTHKLADWRKRVGDYRILYDIENKKKEVHILRIWRRGHGY